MTTRIKLDTTLFAAGQKYANLDIKKVSVSVGGSDWANGNVHGGALGIKYARDEMDKLGGRAHIQVTTNPIDVEDAQVNKWPQFWKNSLAALVGKQVIIVERPVGTPLTPAAIIAL